VGRLTRGEAKKPHHLQRPFVKSERSEAIQLVILDCFTAYGGSQ